MGFDCVLGKKNPKKQVTDTKKTVNYFHLFFVFLTQEKTFHKGNYGIWIYVRNLNTASKVGSTQ